MERRVAPAVAGGFLAGGLQAAHQDRHQWGGHGVRLPSDLNLCGRRAHDRDIEFNNSVGGFALM